MKKEVDKYVGKKATIFSHLSLKIEVKILDYKKAYGKERFLVTPVAGSGEKWVEEVTLI